MKISCWACDYTTAKRLVTLRDGSKEEINACPDCGFEFFDFANMDAIESDQFEDFRLSSAGLEIPKIEQDFINGYNQSEDYISSYIDSNHKQIKALEIGCSWGYFLSRLKKIKIECIGIEKNPVRKKYVETKIGVNCYSDLLAV